MLYCTYLGPFRFFSIYLCPPLFRLKCVIFFVQTNPISRTGIGRKWEKCFPPAFDFIFNLFPFSTHLDPIYLSNGQHLNWGGHFSWKMAETLFILFKKLFLPLKCKFERHSSTLLFIAWPFCPKSWSRGHQIIRWATFFVDNIFANIDFCKNDQMFRTRKAKNVLL